MKTILIDGQVKVVEFMQGNQVIRRIVPIDDETADLGIPYGLPFAAMLQNNGLDTRIASIIEQELHRSGLWLASDLQQNPRAVQGAIQAAYGVDTAILLNIVKQFGGNNA